MTHLTIPVITHERADMIANVTQKENETDFPFSITFKKKYLAKFYMTIAFFVFLLRNTIFEVKTPWVLIFNEIKLA